MHIFLEHACTYHPINHSSDHVNPSPNDGWKCRHLDYVLAFTQAPTDTDVRLKTPTSFHVEDSDGNDVSDEFYVKLLKNCYGSSDTAAH